MVGYRMSQILLSWPELILLKQFYEFQNLDVSVHFFVFTLPDAPFMNIDQLRLGYGWIITTFLLVEYNFSTMSQLQQWFEQLKYCSLGIGE